LARRSEGAPLSSVALGDRIALQSGELSFRALLANERAILALDGLLPFARWITPEPAPRRWDARFFLAEAPETQQAQCDGTEPCDAAWLRPLDALAAYRGGHPLLAPPTSR